ncbi:MAG TPA: YicC/YloC family endoribonuclease [Syntrophales bacterium]|nr:YicC/YloC family endoribonuclease [Syntrophales bacterium]
MIKSMTGYGRAETILKGKRTVAEIKSLNHRYLEVSLRLPPTLASLEMEIKKKIAKVFSRGKIEVSIRMDYNGSPDKITGLDLNIPLIRSYYSLLCRIKQELNMKDEITLAMMAAFRDAFAAPEEDDIAAVWQLLEVVLDEAVVALTVMREKEGDVLCRDLRDRAATVARLLDVVGNRGPQALTAYQKRLRERIRELRGDMEIDESRLMQEIAIMAEKSDIMEEIVRLRSHIDQFNDMLQSDQAVGRKVDFLIQEMGREVNTIGSKSGDAETSRHVIEIKSELARIREQVQNIE